MRNLLYTALLACGLVLMAGCGTTATTQANTSSGGSDASEESVVEETAENSQTDAGLGEEQTEEVSSDNQDSVCKILSQYSFTCVPEDGLGTEVFEINYDGSFRGKFYYLDMENVGEGYEEGGTVTTASYEGIFHNPEKIDDTTYILKIDGLKYKNEPGTEVIEDDTKKSFISSLIFDLEGEYTVYLTGSSTESLPEEVWLQIRDNNRNQFQFINETELVSPCISDANTGRTAYSETRISARALANDLYTKYKESYDKYVDKACRFVTTKEANDNMTKAYNSAVACMDGLLILLEDRLDAEDFAKIKDEQTKWQNKRDTEAEKARDAYDGNPIGMVDYATVMAEKTMDRCEDLMEYLPEDIN